MSFENIDAAPGLTMQRFARRFAAPAFPGSPTIKRCCATFISIALVVLIAPTARAVEIVAAASGNWSASATWVGGVLPAAEDDVKIPTGLTVTLNTNVECGGIVVAGKLKVERAKRTLLCDYLVVEPPGSSLQQARRERCRTVRYIRAVPDLQRKTIHLRSQRADSMLQS